jgi:hypothetical protein
MLALILSIWDFFGQSMPMPQGLPDMRSRQTAA